MSQIVDRLAAHLAHLLNDADAEHIWLEPGVIYARLMQVLATRYAATLLFQPSYAWRMSADEAADRYFDSTICRKLKLSGKAPWSVAHRLYLALVRRLPAEGWQAAELVRCPVPTGVPPSLATQALATRLDKVGRGISAGNAAQQIRDRDGPLWIRAGDLWLALPEEMSLWDALLAIPPRLRALPAGEPFNAFCSVMIDALRTANRPVQELLALGHGLCPFDWLDAVSTSQVRSLRRFLATLPGSPCLADLSTQAITLHWQQQPVAGFRHADQFLASELCQALRSPRLRWQMLLDNASAPAGDWLEDDEATQDELLDAAAWQQALADQVSRGRLTTTEAAMLKAVQAGASLDALRSAPTFAEVLNTAGGLDAWAEALLTRLVIDEA